MEGPEKYIYSYNIPYTFPLRKCFLVCLCFMIIMSGKINHQFFFCQNKSEHLIFLMRFHAQPPVNSQM
jgi:hypothetical protein